jgi:hypothetical protein
LIRFPMRDLAASMVPSRSACCCSSGVSSLFLSMDEGLLLATAARDVTVAVVADEDGGGGLRGRVSGHWLSPLIQEGKPSPSVSSSLSASSCTPLFRGASSPFASLPLFSSSARRTKGTWDTTDRGLVCQGPLGNVLAHWPLRLVASILDGKIG